MNKVKKESDNYLRYLILLFLVTTSFLPFSNVISWGSDYAGYILQAKAIHNFDTQEFINTQNFLINLSENPKYPIYTPIGMPLLISVSSFLTKFDMYLVRIIIPISVFFVSLIIYKKNKRYPFLYSLIFVLHPTIIAQYKDAILTESLATMFFLIGLLNKNNKLKLCFFLFSILIRPSFVIFVICDIIFEQKKVIKNLLLTFLSLILINVLTRSIFNMNFYGLYDTRLSDNETFGIVAILVDNIKTILSFEKILLLINELARLFIGFTTNINFVIGIFLIGFLIYIRNKYSLMIIIFSMFHLIWETPSLVRYFIPLLAISFFAFDDFLEIRKIKNNDIIKYFFVLIIAFNLVQLNNSINILENQTGPHQQESKEMLDFVTNSQNENIFSFHSPRTLRLLTNKNSYWLDGDIHKDTVIICYLKESDCKVNENYKIIFKNNLYVISDNE